MRHDVLQEELRPARAIEFRRPRRQRPALRRIEQATAAERQVDHDAHAALARERQQALVRAAVVEREIHLDEVESLLAHHRLEGLVLAIVRGGGAEIADALGRLEFAQLRELRLDILQVVHGNQVERPALQMAERLLDLLPAGVTPGCPQLGGEEYGRRWLQVREELADHRLRIAIRRRRVDHRPAQLEERAKAVAQRGQLRLAGCTLIAACGADADDGNGLATGRDRLHDEVGRPRG